MHKIPVHAGAFTQFLAFSHGKLQSWLVYSFCTSLRIQTIALSGSTLWSWHALMAVHAETNSQLEDMKYAVSRRSVGSHSTLGGVTPPLGTSDWGVIQPRESLIPLIVLVDPPDSLQCLHNYRTLVATCELSWQNRSYPKVVPPDHFWLPKSIQPCQNG